MSAIQLVTPVPGPKSRELWERRQKAVARGLTTLHPVFVAEAHGAVVTDVDGNRLLDFAGGIGALAVGHAHPDLVAAAHVQAQKLTHSAIQVLPYAPYIELAEKLCALAPIVGDKRCFVVTTGTEAVENAVKLARAATRRPGVVVFEHAFHGRSIGALSFTSRWNPYKMGMGPYLPEVYRLPYPTWYRNGQTAEQATEAFKARLAEFFRTVTAPDNLAALIVEPVLGEGGFLTPPPGFFEHLREVTAREGIVLVVDEVQSGFGRTGKLFAIEHFGVEPDLMTVAKSFAGGFPVAAVVGRASLVDAVGPGALGGTYAGNPMACAAALAAIEVIERERLVEKARALGERLRARLNAMAERHALIGDVRGIGAMQAIELVKDRKTRAPATEETAKVVAAARERGLLLLPTGTWGNVIRFLMPLVIEPAALDEGLDVLDAALGLA